MMICSEEISRISPSFHWDSAKIWVGILENEKTSSKPNEPSHCGNDCPFKFTGCPAINAICEPISKCKLIKERRIQTQPIEDSVPATKSALTVPKNMISTFRMKTTKMTNGCRANI